MLHEQSGFTANLVVLPFSPATQAPPTIEPEYCASAPSPLERVAFIESPPSGAPLRVYFARDERVKPVRGLEAFASYLFCPGSTPWVKIYATGEGVAPCASQWCMDGNVGPEPATIEAVREAGISLKIYACQLVPGVELGNGLLYTKDVAVMDRERPLAVFEWLPGSRAQLAQLGVLGNIAAGPSQLDAHVLASPLSASLAFLRTANRLAISLLTTEQRVQLADALAAEREILALLPAHGRAELEAYRAACPAGPGGAGRSKVDKVDGEGELEEGRVTRSKSAPGGKGARKSYVVDGSESE